jgi:creatinine amidohydrolase
LKHLGSLSWNEARDVLSKQPVGLLPIGAIEAHGPHLPLDTDVIIARATALHAARRFEAAGVPSIVLPSVSYTVSFVGTSFPGTSPVDEPAFQQYLTSLLAHLAYQEYRAIVCCNAHLEPAHVQAVQNACRDAASKSTKPVLSPDQRRPEISVRLGDEFHAGSRHAGAYETSIVMAAQPESVRMDKLAELEPVWIDLPARLKDGARTFLDAGSELGYFGDPRSASAEWGHQLLDVLAEIAFEAFQIGTSG